MRPTLSLDSLRALRMHTAAPAIVFGGDRRVVRAERHSAGTRLGYGGTMLEMDSTVAMLRSGFGDGLPSSCKQPAMR